MNNTRRAGIQRLMARASVFEKDLEGWKQQLEGLRDEEEEALSNMPESLEGSERYAMSEEALQNLEDALEEAENLLSSLDAIDGYLDEAMA